MEVGKFEFSVKTLNSFGLPDFKGSTFRGKFGHILKRTICIISHRDCANCQIHGQCAYPYLFETQQNNGQSVPRPFVIEPPLTRKRFFLRDEPLYFHLVLIGRAIEYLPYFVYCFIRMGEEGIGMDRGRYQVLSIRAMDAENQKTEIYDHTSQQLRNSFPRIQLDQFKTNLQPQVTLSFFTPTNIIVEGKRVERLEFSILLKSILRRYHSLRYFHGDGKKERFEIDWDEAKKVEIMRQDLQNQRFKRFSNRQKQPVPLNGFTGTITYRGNLTAFMPWLHIGELLHVGKGTVFGMGGYRVVN